jgi:hypothetical protein
MMDSDLLPCATCPWRKDKDASTIPRFNLGAACNLLDTTTGPEDGFRKIMACHHSTVEDEFACRGYLAVEGSKTWPFGSCCRRKKSFIRSLWRLRAKRAGIKLHRDYETVLAKLAKSVGA